MVSKKEITAVILVIIGVSLFLMLAIPVDAEVVEADDWKVEFNLVHDGLTYKEFLITVQNLTNTKRDLSLDLLFHQTNFDISQVKNPQFWEWKAVDTGVQVPDYKVVYYEVPIVDADNNIIGYETLSRSELVGYHTQVMEVNSWKSCKQQYFNLTDKELKINMETVNMPKFGSNPKYDDFESVTTENGTKTFKLRFGVPLVEAERSWGSSGLFNIVIDNIKFGSSYIGEVGSSWWSDNYDYRRAITLSAHPDNYQIRIALAQYLSGHALDNFDDIRFLEDVTENELYYWFDNESADNAVWVRRPENESYDDNIYIYYGDASAANAENGDMTFILFDHFSGVSVDTAKWTTSGDPVVAGGWVKLTGDTMTSIISFPADRSIRMKVDPTGGDSESFGGRGVTSTQFDIFQTYTTGRTLTYDTDYESSAWAENPNIAVYDIHRNGTTNVVFIEDGITKNTHVTQIPTEDWNVYLGSDAGKELWGDWVLVRKYWSGDPPEVGIEAEESRPAVSPTVPVLYLPENESTVTAAKPYFEWENAENADNHYILIDNDSDCLSPIENVTITADNNYTAFITENSDNTYYWRVVAVNEVGENASVIWSYTIDIIVPEPSPLYRTTLVWTENEPDENYDVQISSVSNFITILHQENNRPENSFTYDFTESGTYYWRVRVITSGGATKEWSTTQTIWINVSPRLSEGLAVSALAIGLLAVAVAAKRYKKRK